MKCALGCVFEQRRCWVQVSCEITRVYFLASGWVGKTVFASRDARYGAGSGRNATLGKAFGNSLISLEFSDA